MHKLSIIYPNFGQNNKALKRIIYQDYGKKGSVDATIGMYLLSKAIEKDMILQGRDFKPHTYNGWIAEAMNPSNNTGFKNGIIRGEILFKGEPWEPSYGKTKGEDLARAIVYTLRNQGGYEWSNVRKCVEAMPAPFNELSTVTYDELGTTGDIVNAAITPAREASTLGDALEALEKAKVTINKAIKRDKDQQKAISQKTSRK